MNADTNDRIVYMANQIARNLALEPDPVAAVADHILAFWTPQMKTTLLASPPASLDPLVREAAARLATGPDPRPQTRATDPHAQGSDAG